MNSADLQSFHAEERSSVSTNGGRITDSLITTGEFNNVWPNALKAERIAGSTLHRKIFEKANDDADGTLIAPQFWQDMPTEADDYVIFFEGTDRDTEAGITGSERKFGAANLLSDITGNPSTFVVIVEDSTLASGAQAIFKDGDTIRLTDMVTPTSGTGNEEFLTINGTPSVASSVQVTITVDQVIANDYLVADAGRVMSVWEPSDIETSQSAHSVTTAGTGDYDYSTYSLTLDNIGTVNDELTFTWTDATHFTCVGASGISYGSGQIGTNFIPENPDWTGKPYFTLLTAGFSGVWASGDTFTVTLVGAYVSRWFKRIIPAATASLSGNKVVSVTAGEFA